MILETDRLILRPWNKEDGNRLYELASDSHVGPPCGWSPHKNIRESKAVLRDVLINEYTFAICEKESKAVIGNIALMPYYESRFAQNEEEAEIGFWLGYPYWGNGYMVEACVRMVKYGLEEKGFQTIWCAHNLDNHNSMRVQKKSGFVYHHEDVYYARELEKKVCVKVNCIKIF